MPYGFDIFGETFSARRRSQATFAINVHKVVKYFDKKNKMLQLPGGFSIV